MLNVFKISQIEDIEISKTMVVGKDFLEEINNDFMIIAKNNHKDLVLEAKIVSKQLYLDKQIIFKILENLLNNAFRFANNGVKLTIMELWVILNLLFRMMGRVLVKRI